MKPTIENLLHGNGNLISAAQRKMQSLSGPDRRIIDRVRTKAIAAGYGWQFINALEMEGERGIRGSMPMPIDAEFRGLQETGIFGISTRLYNIEGDHFLNHSTVGVITLLHNKIMPLDISLPRIGFEYLKEQILMAYFYSSSVWQVLKIKLGVNS